MTRGNSDHFWTSYFLVSFLEIEDPTIPSLPLFLLSCALPRGWGTTWQEEVEGRGEVSELAQDSAGATVSSPISFFPSSFPVIRPSSFPFPVPIFFSLPPTSHHSMHVGVPSCRPPFFLLFKGHDKGKLWPFFGQAIFDEFFS